MALSPGSSESHGQVERLLAHYEPAIRRYIERRAHPRLLASTSVEDLFQLTAETALRSAGTFVYLNEGRFLGWVKTIARRIMSRAAREGRGQLDNVRIRREESSGEGIACSALDAEMRSPSSFAASHEWQGAMRRALGRLPDRYRDVLIRYKLEERSLQEVAEEMDLSPNGAVKLIGRALKALRKEMAQDGFREWIG